MYSFLEKGFTNGGLFVANLLGRSFAVIGSILDHIFAIAWMPDYSSYWNRRGFDTPVTSTVYYGAAASYFASIAEFLGFGIGGVAGIATGLVLYFPYQILRGASYLYQKSVELLTKHSNAVEGYNRLDHNENGDHNKKSDHANSSTYAKLFKGDFSHGVNANGSDHPQPAKSKQHFVLIPGGPAVPTDQTDAPPPPELRP